MKNLDHYKELLITHGLPYVTKAALAIVVFVIGWIIINSVVKFFRKTMTKRNVDPSLVPFVSSIFNVLLKTMLIISVATMVGIETTSFIAVLGAAGLAIGLALQGSLANFAGGVLILTLKPFKVGDVIEAQGVIALVHEIQIFNTILKTYDNKTIIMPNGQLSNNVMTNYSTEPTRKVEWVFGIGYSDDIDKAKGIIKKLIAADERILDRDDPFIKLAELGDSSVNFKVRALVNQPDYWSVFFEMNENLKKTFDKEGVSIPFPQRDIHLFQQK